MKITFFFLIVFSSLTFANDAASQVSLVTLNIRSGTLEELISQIEEQTDYLFSFNAEDVDLETNISVHTRNESVESILKRIFNEKRISFKIQGDNIILIKEDETKSIQEQGKKVTGKVTEENGQPLPGVTITVLGSTKGVITDVDGKFEIYNIEPSDKLVFSFIGMESQIIDVGNQDNFKIELSSKSEQLEDVTVVAFGRQKKESVLASITTVKPADLKVPSSNLTTALAGKLSGIISYQRSGEPGQDNAEFFIRGVTTFGYSKSPLILIDGVENTTSDLANLQPDDIASFSIMKDATATALYGARGANGVILVTTKEGVEGKARVSVRFENSISSPTDRVKLADPITYMKLHNEAVLTRDPLGILPYSQEKIDKTIEGKNPLLYPSVDWYNELFKSSTVNQRLNFNVSGGGKVSRYYLAATVNQDNGNLKVDGQNNFNNNIDLKRYQLRSNININITPTTEAIIRFNGVFDDYSGPLDGGSGIYNKVISSNPVLFQPYYKKTTENQYVRHIMFGNYGQGNYVNPYADLIRGYKEYDKTKISAQFEIEQNLDFLLKGLSGRALGSINRYSNASVERFYNPFYYSAIYNYATNQVDLKPLNENEGTEYLDYSEGTKDISSDMYMEGALQYNKVFNKKHSISGLLVYTRREEKVANAGNLQKSLPYRNQGLSGRFTYSHNEKYFSEFNFGYNGSERFAKKERFGFFPSAGLGWIVSKEDFFTPWTDKINVLKLKATYGLVGNDAIGSVDDRFFYISQVNLNDGGRGTVWGERLDYYVNGISIQRYENDLITWETAKKLNVGFELGLFNAINIQADFFREDRENILMNRLRLASMGLESNVSANVGSAYSQGFDASIDFNKYFTEDFWITGRANFTYATGKKKEVEEPDYSDTPWLSAVDRSINQSWGFIAERLFIDEKDVANSPLQTFGEYGPGDIKYRDINGDDKITGLDRVPIGYPTAPEIIYGFGISTGYKNLDFSCFFQGSARSSFWIDTYKTAPFINSGENGKLVNQALLQAYADDYWSENNRNIYALWPRLSDEIVQNNNQLSTWFMQDGTFLRVKSIEFGYSLPKQVIQKIKLDHLRIYISGTNLFTFSNFKIWDPEMGGNGLGYPIQKVVNMGIQLNF
ncbi:SusC/RagA family TonB-linked outer membrane protein [Maribellus luteus]|uniref:SusC/RagA family TonB-linked outer membrane protein n=2 Tax=Maribellus luteus TaxID=2305463 RepID=A0A399SZ29_9BACT|nr:SusC/RagA family TonB-linked outer membrane protein [Maribellus luteus]